MSSPPNLSNYTKKLFVIDDTMNLIKFTTQKYAILDSLTAVRLLKYKRVLVFGLLSQLL